MFDEKHAKLKLKRKKTTPLPPVTSRDNTNKWEKQIRLENEVSTKQEPAEKISESTSSWLNQTDLSKTEKPWNLVLKATCLDVNLERLENVPDFPAFNQQNATMEKCKTEEKVFTIGTKVIAWIPFPPFCKPEVSVIPEESSPTEGCNPTSQIKNVTRNENCKSRTKNNLPPFSKKSLRAKDRIQVSGTGPAETETPFSGSIDKKFNFEISAMENQDHKNLRQIVGIHTHIISGDITGITTLPNDKSEKSPGIHYFSDQKSKGNKVSLGTRSTVRTSCIEKDASVVLEQDSPDQVEGKQSCSNAKPEREHSSKEASTKTLALLNCPMCLQRFPEGFTQLDVDSHLAKCLSESTDDVMW
ncbi:Fanconi anemia core complex-associated protein 20 [Protopterus annectens]|uniref:Fanconi anemia core complex-associated protein 20 n=1 Tax=Protopterus annectens TaxID=7888 RepID=UPI001CFAAFCD|nr:Fanconi anemia core complex-associated protein 20 [Protopterus annectens]